MKNIEDFVSPGESNESENLAPKGRKFSDFLKKFTRKNRTDEESMVLDDEDDSWATSRVDIQKRKDELTLEGDEIADKIEDAKDELASAEREKDKSEKRQARKEKIDQLVERFAPERIKNFLEARDVSKKIENSEAYKIFSSNKEERNKRVLDRQAIEESENSNNAAIKRIEGEVKTAHSILAKRKELAGGDPDLLVDAETSHIEALEAYEQRLSELNEKKDKIRVEKEIALEFERGAESKLEIAKEELRGILDLRIEKVEIFSGVGELGATIESQTEKVKDLEAISQKIASKLSAYKKTLELGGYGKEEKRALGEKMNLIEADLKSANKALSEAKKNLTEARGNKEVIVERIKAIDNVSKKLGFEREVSIPESSDKDGKELIRAFIELEKYSGGGNISSTSLDRMEARFSGGGGGGGRSGGTFKESRGKYENQKKPGIKKRRFLESLFSFFRKP